MAGEHKHRYTINLQRAAVEPTIDGEHVPRRYSSLYVRDMNMHTSRLHLMKNCENCGKGEFSLDSTTQENICVNCGHVVQTKIEEGAEWRSFEGEEGSRIRVGMPPNPLMPDKGISTVIGSKYGDSTERISAKFKTDLRRLRMLQRRITLPDSKDRNLAVALRELNELGERLEIPLFVLERASNIYRTALERDLIRGRSIKSVVAAALYAAIRQTENPRTLKEISEASGQEKRELAKKYRLIVRKLRLRLPMPDPVKYVRKICSEAGLSKKVMLEAQKIIRLAQEEKLTGGKNPTVMAAAATYYACILLNVEVTQQDIANAADVTETTVRNRFQGLKNALNLEGEAAE